MFGSSDERPKCEKPSKSSAMAARIAMNGLSVSAQSPINPSGTTLHFGPAENLPSAPAWTGHAGNGTEDCLTPASTSGQSSSGSQKQTYWLEEKRTQDWLETTVYKQDLKRAHYWADVTRHFQIGRHAHKPLIEGLFCAELEQGLTIADAARLLRAKREGPR